MTQDHGSIGINLIKVSLRYEENVLPHGFLCIGGANGPGIWAGPQT
jgi:hypothetical protein